MTMMMVMRLKQQLAQKGACHTATISWSVQDDPWFWHWEGQMLHTQSLRSTLLPCCGICLVVLLHYAQLNIV